LRQAQRLVVNIEPQDTVSHEIVGDI
jgi:hypothetical protein